MRSLFQWGGTTRVCRGASPIAAVPIVIGLLLVTPALPTGAATVRAPLPSAVSTSGDSWVSLPMGELSDENNTFWQLLHSVPGSSHWSLVTPEGVADNGGLVAGATAGSIVIGFLPSNLLRYSPLAQSADGGATWTPKLLPAGLAALPDALGYGMTGSGGAIAAVSGGDVLTAPASLAHWSLLVSVSRLARMFPSCGVTTIDAVAILPTGSPLVATGCRRGVVGIFTKDAGTWTSYGTRLSGESRSGTVVLRLEASGPTTAALAATAEGDRRALVALWRQGAAPWTTSAPLTVPSGTSVLASAVGDDGALAVVLGSRRNGARAFSIDPDGAWAQLPPPPAGTSAIALPSSPPTVDAKAIDAFTVRGGSLGVFALTPSGATWVRVQSSQVALAYGSSG